MLSKISYHVAGAVLALFLSLNAQAAIAGKGKNSGTATVSLSQSLDPVIEKAITEKRLVGAVVLVALDGKLIYHRAAGYADPHA